MIVPLDLPAWVDESGEIVPPARRVWHLYSTDGSRAFVMPPAYWWQRARLWARGYRCTHHYWMTKPSERLRRNLMALTEGTA